ncbi:hypothetical protein E1286_18350 [Nonomuraea terrae]|uniref:Uncharacterized protein n=1 Tax=Nonomuraea terrae TaxID=2530383 RepID=A0A4V2YLM1_9ACTN|nr:hypothetical protein [Nonomuraea terrae]TDD47237.1 hypothetical protein E1286_18350 [Nonomuraea terrae]
MKVTRIAASCVFAGAASLVVMAAPAHADRACELNLSDVTHTLRIDRHGVSAGKRDAKACKLEDMFPSHARHHDDMHHDDMHHDDMRHDDMRHEDMHHEDEHGEWEAPGAYRMAWDWLAQ